MHFPPILNFHSISWAKIIELMSKQIFFIIEENEELYIKNLDKIIVYYNRYNINDLYDKIIYYLNNEEERINHIKLCYSYVVKNFNMDNFILKII